MYFFTADEHYCHKNIIKFCDRPFSDVSHMHEVLITNHNAVVRENDIVIIKLWDFQLTKADIIWRYTGTQAEYLRKRGLLEKLPS